MGRDGVPLEEQREKSKLWGRGLGEKKQSPTRRDGNVVP